MPKFKTPRVYFVHLFFLIFEEMKKIVFWVLTILGVFLIYKISYVLYSTHEMTDYTFGYLVGQIILLMIVIVLAAILGRRIFKG